MNNADWVSYIPWRGAFEAVMDARFYTLTWLDEEITSGRARLWENGLAAIVATIREYPTGAKAVHGLIAAGDLANICKLIPLAEEWGRSQGAIVAEIDSREGWGRALRTDGYSVLQTALRKELI